jgi:peroxiredoxin Q/BCP
MKALFLLCAATAILGLAPQDRALQPGDVAPDFSLPGSDGKTYSLADFRGQRPVVLAWFPKANVKT